MPRALVRENATKRESGEGAERLNPELPPQL